jgi:hypothetical protein
VVNGAGEPVRGVRVSAESKPSDSSGGLVTVEGGRFRIWGLLPGKYFVRAWPQNSHDPPEIRADGTTELQDATTYFPGSLDAGTAQRVEVTAGAEVSGIEIKLLRVPIVQVSGKVLGIPPGVNDVMVSTQPFALESVKPDGTFSFWRLDPGKHTLQAQQWGPVQLRSAPVDIEVASTNLEHIELRLMAPFDVAGHLRFDDEAAGEPPKASTGPRRPDDGDAPPIPPRPRTVQLFALHGQLASLTSASVNSDDTFTLSQVEPAQYRVVVLGVSGLCNRCAPETRKWTATSWTHAMVRLARSPFRSVPTIAKSRVR